MGAELEPKSEAGSEHSPPHSLQLLSLLIFMASVNREEAPLLISILLKVPLSDDEYPWSAKLLATIRKPERRPQIHLHNK